MAGADSTPLLRLALLAAYLTGCQSLHIIDLAVPEVIQNGTRSSVVLDCAYRYERYEKEDLVVKWFFNREPEAVYQWILGKKPEAMGILKGRVNLEYHATKDKYSRHRALEILHPTTELTGTYTCLVSSFHDEEFASKSMIVYAPATSMNMTYSKASATSVNISCEAHGLYPEPTLALRHSTTRTPVESDVEVVDVEDGYSICLQAMVEDRTLPRETIFECVLHIPQTEYQVRRSLIYLPGYGAFGAYGGATVVSANPLLSLLLLLLLLPPPFLSLPAAVTH